MLIFFITLILNHSSLFSSGNHLEIINIIDFDAEAEEENNEDGKEFNNFFYTIDKSMKCSGKESNKQSYIDKTLHLIFLKVIMLPPEV